MQLFKIKCTSRIWDMRSLPSETARESRGNHGKPLLQKEALERPFLCPERWHVAADRHLPNLFLIIPVKKPSSPQLAACSASYRVLWTRRSKLQSSAPIPHRERWIASSTPFAN